MTPTRDQLGALEQVWMLADKHRGTGGGNCAGQLLLSLYNGRRFPFDLTELRRLDRGNFEAVLMVLEMDFQPAMEVHEQLNLLFGRADMGPRLEVLAWEMRLKGAAKKAVIEDLRRSLSRRADGVPA